MLRPAPWTPPKSPPNRFEADGIILRAYTAADAPQLLSTVDGSRASLLPWMPWAVTQHRSLDESLSAIRLFEACALDPLAPGHEIGYVFGVFSRSSAGAAGELLGGAGIARIAAPTHTAEIGYWTREDRRGRGIATAAARACINWAFLPQDQGGFGLRRMMIFAATENTFSCRIPPRIGLHEFMHARQDRWLDGLGWHDTRGWEILASDWPGLGHGT